MAQVRSGVSKVGVPHFSRSVREVGPFHVNQDSILGVATTEIGPKKIGARSRTGHPSLRQAAKRPQAPRRSQPRSGRRMKPTAQAVGKLCEKSRSPVGAKENNLLPDVPFVIRNLILLEERHKLLLKRPRPMMLFLVRDMPTDRRHIRFAHAERPIPGLPGETSFPLSSRPSRRVRLNHPHHIGHALRWTNANQHVDVIGGAIDDERSAAEFADNTTEVSEQIISHLGSD